MYGIDGLPILEDKSANYIPAKNGHLYLQSHWGSGVVYTINWLNSNGENNGNN